MNRTLFSLYCVLLAITIFILALSMQKQKDQLRQCIDGWTVCSAQVEKATGLTKQCIGMLTGGK